MVMHRFSTGAQLYLSQESPDFRAIARVIPVVTTIDSAGRRAEAPDLSKAGHADRAILLR
jgi:hypothetical protein